MVRKYGNSAGLLRLQHLVRHMMEAGMIVLGKPHTVEFAMDGFGTNRYLEFPKISWDLKEHRATGGSSAGTTAAVSAGLAPWGMVLTLVVLFAFL